MSIRRLTGGLTLLGVIIVAFFISGPATTAAQNTATPVPMTCAQVVPMVQKNLAASCGSVAGNQICYGNPQIQAEFMENATNIPFANVGDMAPLSAIKSITTAPLDLTNAQWGLAVLKVQAALPGTAAGQFVTFILYGDTTINGLNVQPSTQPASTAVTCSATTTRATYLRAAPGANEAQVQLLQANTTVNVTGRSGDGSWVWAQSADQTGWLFIRNLNMGCDVQSLPEVGVTNGVLPLAAGAFYFTTGVGAEASCNDVPPGGLLIQSPAGQQISFVANGATITIGSDVILRAQPNHAMTVAVLKGHVAVTAANQTQTITTGEELSVPLGGANGLDASGPPSPGRPIANDNVFAPFLCKIAQSAGITIPCTSAPIPTPRPATRIPPSRIPSTRVPSTRVPAGATSTPVVSTGPTCTFTVNNFSADNNPAILDRAKKSWCTTMRWDVQGVETVYFDGRGVTGQGSTPVCIQQDTTYTLTMNCGGRSQSVNYTLRIR